MRPSTSHVLNLWNVPPQNQFEKCACWPPSTPSLGRHSMPLELRDRLAVLMPSAFYYQRKIADEAAWLDGPLSGFSGWRMSLWFFGGSWSFPVKAHWVS